MPLAVLISIYIVIGVLYVFLYSFAAFMFSYKIYLVTHEKYLIGSLVSGIGLFINFSLYAFIPFIAISLNIWPLALLLLISLGVGAFFANAVMNKVDFLHSKDEKECD